LEMPIDAIRKHAERICGRTINRVHDHEYDRYERGIDVDVMCFEHEERRTEPTERENCGDRDRPPKRRAKQCQIIASDW